jgi:hypothetical protein
VLSNADSSASAIAEKRVMYIEGSPGMYHERRLTIEELSREV